MSKRAKCAKNEAESLSPSWSQYCQQCSSSTRQVLGSGFSSTVLFQRTSTFWRKCTNHLYYATCLYSQFQKCCKMSNELMKGQCLWSLKIVFAWFITLKKFFSMIPRYIISFFWWDKYNHHTFFLRSSISMHPSASTFTGLTVIPAIWALAGLVPCADVGIKHT